MPGDTHQKSNQPLQITVSFDYLVNVGGNQVDIEGLQDNLVFRLGYDEAEIPFGEKVLAALKNEISEVLPRSVNVNRVGGALFLNGEKIKNF